MADLGSSGKDAGTSIREMRCPIAILYGEKSRFFSSEVCDYLGSLLPPENLLAIGAAYHHLFLDQPLAFLLAVRVILGRWQGPGTL
jgi:pimeloyl-ACP methyl ester carboxylesterase